MNWICKNRLKKLMNKTELLRLKPLKTSILLIGPLKKNIE